MTKSFVDVIKEVAGTTGFSQKDCKEVIRALVNVVGKTVADGDNAKISEFGIFKAVDVPERTRVQTFGERKGEEYTVPAHRTMKFSISSSLKSRIAEA